MSSSDQTNTTTPPDDHDKAAALIRQKISALYEDEPDAKEEILDAEEAGRHRSKHQKFMYDLSTSGKSLAEIQTAWHAYYVELSDKEKHEVWQEFYKANEKSTQPTPATTAPKPQAAQHHTEHSTHAKSSDPRTVADLKATLAHKAGGKRKLSKKHHFQSIAFGLSMGAVMMLVLLFGFFNERFVAPFITPSRNVSTTPIIIDPSSSSVGPEPKIIIPKINVEIPVVYDQPSITEAAVQASLEQGVVHYATSANPGQNGNTVIVGHSSNNIFNKGKYKFAFVLLKRLELGDTFTLNKDGKQYVYKVSDKKIVKPSDVSVLAGAGKPIVTLITCDPPGTSLNRLVVTGEQITPDPSSNSEPTTTASASEQEPAIVPGNAPSLWHRLTGWISS